MAEKKLSPRQRMINMMYLVLTALLALNVSKEVLQSFFEVNKGIERTTNNFNLKNGETYSAFDNAAENNPEKYKDVRDRAFSVKNKVDAIALYIQEMKYDLVSAVDKEKVCLGSPKDVLDEDGQPIDSKLIEGKKFSELSNQQKYMPIAYLSNKDNRDKSGDLFYPKNLGKNKKRASVLKRQIEEYRDFLIELADDNQALIDNINLVCDVSNKGSGKKLQTWEQYNFVDMPSVGALTLLSKIQSDLRNIEADMINYLKKDIDAKSLKFGDAEAVSIPKSNFVLRGDSFRATIFTAAKQEGQEPEIWVGDFDSLGGGQYEMVGDYEIVRVVNGKGMFARRTTSEGNQKWGGLIAMKTETGTKFYPFKGEYLVAAKTAVAAPTNMNVLYKSIENPIQVSVAGYLPSQISVICSNGKISPLNKKEGRYIVVPNKLHNENKPIITLFVNREGKRTNMGSVEFKVKEVPPPEIMCAKKFGGIITKGDLSNASGLFCVMRDFPFDRNALSYKVVSFDVSAYNKDVKRNIPTIKSNKFNQKVVEAIKGTAPGKEISFTNIKVQLKGNKKNRILDKGSITFTIK